MVINERYKLDSFPDFVRFIDNEDMAKWFIVVLKYAFYSGYTTPEDLVVMLEIEFNKLTDDDADKEYIDLVYQDSSMSDRLKTTVEQSEIALIDKETGEEYLESYYLTHFTTVIEECFEEMQTYFKLHEQKGFTNAMFPENQGGKKILWLGTQNER